MEGARDQAGSSSMPSNRSPSGSAPTRSVGRTSPSAPALRIRHVDARATVTRSVTTERARQDLLLPRPVSLVPRLVESRSHPPGEDVGGTHAPVVEEDDPWFLTRHVLMYGHDVDAGVSERLQHALELRLEHGKVSIHDRALVRTREGRPGVHAHGGRNLLAVHAGGPADGHFVDARAEAPLVRQDRFDLAG